jgi:hypothetical protein
VCMNKRRRNREVCTAPCYLFARHIALLGCIFRIGVEEKSKGEVIPLSFCYFGERQTGNCFVEAGLYTPSNKEQWQK